MSLQNRVNPMGEIIISTSRGTLMGNRGVLHNKNKELVKSFDSKAWITCRLDYSGKKRDIMYPGRYTELFFLDEATSFSAGHRPCSLCRNNDFQRFKNLWLDANGKLCEDIDNKIETIDCRIHKDRVNNFGKKVLFLEMLFTLPDGVFVGYPNNMHNFYLYHGNCLLQWSEYGYSSIIRNPKNEEVIVLTPESIVNTFRNGYCPKIHETAYKLLL